MSFKHIVGQNQPIDILKKSLENGALAHSYLFYGSDSVGKKLTALTLASTLNCSQSPAVEACGRCSSCRKIDQGIHPDIFLVEPVKSSPSAREGYIRIDQIRDLQKKLNYLPYEGNTKVAIIDSAEKMNPQAANAFLKTLEEPPQATLLILIATNLYQLLPTIISRCQGILFHPLSPGAIREILSQNETIDPGELEFRVTHSQGRVSRGLEEDLSLNTQNREELLDLIDRASFDQMDLVFQWAKVWAKSTDRLPALLDELINLLRDLALLKTCNQPALVSNQDLLVKLKLLAGKKKLLTLLAMFESVIQTKQALQSNLNVQLTLENMLLKFCDAT